MDKYEKPLRKNLLILSGGTEAVEGINIAKKMGLKTIVCDGNKNAPGKYIADEFLLGNIYDPDEIKRVIRKYSKKKSIDGVITIASDAVRSVSTVVELLNLPGNDMKTSILSTDKLKMKKLFKKNSIPIPRFVGIKTKKELGMWIKAFDNAVLKPVDSRGSRGVIRVNRYSDIGSVFNYSKKFSPSQKLILEEWVDGKQLSSESLVIGGKTHLCGIADRNYSNLKNTFPYVIEDGGNTPTILYSKIKDELQIIMDSVAKSFRIKNGVLKGDLVLKNNHLYVIEVATRLSGGFFSTVSIPLVYRINLVEKAILLALGLEITPPPRNLKHYCYEANRYIFPEKGTIQKITKPIIKKLPKYVTHFEINANVGDRIETITNHPMRKGRIQVIGKTKSQCVKRAEKIRDLIKIETSLN